MSFVRGVEVGKTDLRPRFTIPIVVPATSGGETEEALVLPIIRSGSPGRIRTYDLAVNSRPLYR